MLLGGWYVKVMFDLKDTAIHLGVGSLGRASQFASLGRASK
jgi:hypothetical protein